MVSKNKKIRQLVFMMLILLFLVLVIGIFGYRVIFRKSWTNSIYNATITASTLGLELQDRTRGEKIFTGFYALASGIFFVSLISAIISYIFTTSITENIECASILSNN